MLYLCVLNNDIFLIFINWCSWLVFSFENKIVSFSLIFSYKFVFCVLLCIFDRFLKFHDLNLIWNAIMLVNTTFMLFIAE